MGDTTLTLYEIECPLCGRICDIRLSRLGNPYFTCPDCGLRCFVNSPAGKGRLYELAKEKGSDA
jgi:tRNA(Ile2) C34 agmatinyltransferase TiaS